MNIEAIRLLADDADVSLDASMLKFAELVIERCAIVAERQGQSGVALEIRGFFEIDDRKLTIDSFLKPCRPTVDPIIRGWIDVPLSPPWRVASRWRPGTVSRMAPLASIE